jgi:GNAT superfamily N-acetyltransferase
VSLDLVTAEESSLDTFLGVTAESRHHNAVREYVAGLLEQGRTRLDWCLVALGPERPLAHAALWAPAGHAVPTDVVVIETDWTDPELEAGRELLAELHDRARDLGADALEHMLDSPPVAPQYQEHEDARVRLLESSGYQLVRDGLRWQRSPSAPTAIAPDPRLEFRSLTDVGEPAFVAAIAATFEGTADSALGLEIDELGREGAAQKYFDDMQTMTYRPEWWELAFADDGEPAGVIMAAASSNLAVIGYVGVVPAHRGRGFAAPLVERGTTHVSSTGADRIIGDCDRGNPGMVRAFARAGYEQFARRRAFRRTL